MRSLFALMLLFAAPTAGYRAEIEQYRRDRIAELTAPDGWLAVRGLFWLHDGANEAGSATSAVVRLPDRAPRQVGVFVLADRRVTFRADPSAGVTSGGRPVSVVTLDPNSGDATALTVAHVTLAVIRRGDRTGIRMFDPESAQRRAFRGLEYFPIDPVYRLRARFVPYDSAREVPVPNVLGQLVPMESPGDVEFALHGRTYRLQPVYETAKHADLFFIFKDLTSRSETYEAGRFLHAPLPKNGVVDLDFNRAYNPPCAFTEYATCPLPVKANQLAVRIPAGERRYHEAAVPSPLRPFGLAPPRGSTQPSHGPSPRS